uniref:Cohesin domain-containing protein n=1 Tax=candidate division WOR-3 bacterium TaxID=2052148 RepID=A0A7V3VUY4_UNCW3
MSKLVKYLIIIPLVGFSETILYIDPPVVPQKEVGDTFTVSLKVADVVNLNAFEAIICYDPAILSIIGVTEGPFLKRGGIPTDFWYVPQNPGSFYVAGARGGVSNFSGTYGSGILAYIKCQVNASGNSPLDISDTTAFRNLLMCGDSLTTTYFSGFIPFIKIDGYYGMQTDCNSRDEFLISTSTYADSAFFPTVAWADTQYLCVWQTYTNLYPAWLIYGQRISSNGTFLGANTPIIDLGTRSWTTPCLGWCDSVFTSVFKRVPRDDTTSDAVDIVGKNVTPAGSSGSNFSISTASSIQCEPAIAFNNGGKYLVVWEDHRAGQSTSNADIYGQVLNRSGTLIGLNFPICNASGNQSAPAVYWADSKYLVVWADGRNNTIDHFWYYIYGQFVDSLGNLIGSEIPITQTNEINQFPDVSFNGTNYLVVWQKLAESEHISDIYGQFVSTNGSLIGSNFVICNESHYQAAPKVIWDGSTYLVFWQDERNGSTEIFMGRGFYLMALY